MAIVIQARITDESTPAIEALRKGLESGSGRRVIGRALTNSIRSHLLGLNASRPNALGGRRTNFYAQAARSTNFQEVPDGVVVSINHLGIRQRYEGGEIRPVRRKYLTIPAIAEAHGRRAGEFNNLRFGFAQNKYGNLSPALIETSASRVKFIRRKDGSFRAKNVGTTGGRVFFWLSRRVFQKADATVLPTKADMEATVVAAADTYVRGLISGKGEGTT